MLLYEAKLPFLLCSAPTTCLRYGTAANKAALLIAHGSCDTDVLKYNSQHIQAQKKPLCHLQHQTQLMVGMVGLVDLQWQS